MRWRNHTRKGFNLIEAAIVLGVVGFVIGGIWVAASSVNENWKINKNIEMAISIKQCITNKFPRMSCSPSAPYYVCDVSSINKWIAQTNFVNDIGCIPKDVQMSPYPLDAFGKIFHVIFADHDGLAAPIIEFGYAWPTLDNEITVSQCAKLANRSATVMTSNDLYSIQIGNNVYPGFHSYSLNDWVSFCQGGNTATVLVFKP